MEQVSLRHIKTKGDLKSDDPEKKKDDIGSEKILERKQKYLKRFKKKECGGKALYPRTLDDEVQPYRG